MHSSASRTTCTLWIFPALLFARRKIPGMYYRTQMFLKNLHFFARTSKNYLADSTPVTDKWLLNYSKVSSLCIYSLSLQEHLQFRTQKTLAKVSVFLLNLGQNLYNAQGGKYLFLQPEIGWNIWLYLLPVPSYTITFSNMAASNVVLLPLP